MKRGTQFLILSCFFALCLAQPQFNWDQSLDGSLQVVAERNYPVPFKPLANAILLGNQSDLSNNNNNFLRSYSSANITLFLDYETQNKTADESTRQELIKNATAFVQVKKFLALNIYQVLNGRDGYDPEVQDFVINARHILRALAARYRQQELEQYSYLYEKHEEFAARRALVRDARIKLLQGYRNVTLILEGVVKNNCLGLGLLGVCNIPTLLEALTRGALANLANLTSSITVVNETLNNLSSLVTSYNADVQTFLNHVNDSVGNYTIDNEDYAQVLLALKNYRTLELPTWEDVVLRLQVLLVQDPEHVVFKRLLKKLWVGWTLGLDGETISYTNTSAIVVTSQVLDLSFSVLLTRDNNWNSTVNETREVAAVKLQSALKSVLQTYAWVARIYSGSVEVGGDGIAHIRIVIRYVDVDGSRQIAWLSRNVTLPDPSTYQAEYDEFVAALEADAGALIVSVNNTLQNLTSVYRNYSDEIERKVEALLELRQEYYDNATALAQNFTQGGVIVASRVAGFASLLVQKYVDAANQTLHELRVAVETIGAAVQEADARVQVLKLQAIQIALDIANTTETQAKAALQATLDTLQEQIAEALQYREFKKRVYANATESVEASYARAQAQQAVLEANVNSINANVTIALSEIKRRIRSNYQEFVDSVLISYRAIRQSLNNLNITANSDLNANDNVSLTFTVVLVDTGAIGEDAAARANVQVSLLKAIFASITTDINIQVNKSAKRQTGSDVYTVRSGTTSPTTPTSTPTSTPTGTPTSTPTGTPTGTPTATPTSTPTGTPTNTPVATPSSTPVDPVSGALSVAMSFLAIFACVFNSLI